MDVTCAFVRRMLSICIHFPVEFIKSIVSIVKRVVLKYPKVRFLFTERDDDGADIYNPEAEDP